MLNSLSNILRRTVFYILCFWLKIVSLGRFDLAKADLNSSAPKHIWAVLWPYFVSTRPWSIMIPESVIVPTFKLGFSSGVDYRSFLWAPVVVALAFWGLSALAPDTFALVSAFALPASGNFSLWDYVLGYNFLVVVSSLVALHFVVNLLVGCFKSLELPFISQGTTRVPLLFGGTKLFTLPTFVQSWVLIGLIGFGCWLVNDIGLLVNGLNGKLSTALQKKDLATFVAVLWQFVKIMGIMTILGPVYSWVKELVILGWSRHATAQVLDEYTDGEARPYYAISLRKTPDNPNERIQQDLPAMCRLVMYFLFALLDAVITLYMFGGKFWDMEKTLSFDIPLFGHTITVQHMMLTALILYAFFGTNGATVVGRKLIGLNAEQRKREAHFRVLMVMFEKFAEPIAAYRGEQREHEQLWRRFVYSLANNYVILRWRMLLGVFTGAYGKVAQFLPLLTLAPFYFGGKIEMGAISEASGACAEILGALSLIVAQFDSLSQIFACGNRVGELRTEIATIAADRRSQRERIQRLEEEDVLLKIENMDLYSPGGEKLLVCGLNLDLSSKQSVLVRGASGSGKTSILRALAGLPLWDYGSGKIRIAPHSKTMMLTQLAYTLSEGTLREQLLYPMAANVADGELLEILKVVNLSTLVERFNDELTKVTPDFGKLSLSERYALLLDMVPNWDSLSGGERQRLMVARALVNRVLIVFADEATSGLDIANEQLLYTVMKEHGIIMLSVGHRPSLVPFHDVVIELLNDGFGGWRMMPADQSQW